MAKKPLKAKSKAVVGRAKKKWSLSLSKRSALFGLVSILAFSIIGGAGYQKWEDNQLEAQAASTKIFSYAGDGYNIFISACRPIGTNKVNLTYYTSTLRGAAYYANVKGLGTGTNKAINKAMLTNYTYIKGFYPGSSGKFDAFIKNMPTPNGAYGKYVSSLPTC